jgi:hypothetical protein
VTARWARAIIPAPQTRDARQLFRIPKGLSTKLVNASVEIPQESWIGAAQ